nr:unnamed protein product [Haemonchus contortus]
MLEKISQHRAKSSKHVVHDGDILDDVLSRYDWQILDAPTEDYDALARDATMDLLRTRSNLRLDQNATHHKAASEYQLQTGSAARPSAVQGEETTRGNLEQN